MKPTWSAPRSKRIGVRRLEALVTGVSIRRVARYGTLATLVLEFAMSAAAQTSITSFETPADITAWQTNHARVAAVTEHVTEGRQALQIVFEPAEWPNIRLVPGTPWDWHEFGALVLDITNPGAEAVAFGVRVDDDPAADGRVHCRQGHGTLEPGATATFALLLVADPMSRGMRGWPLEPGLRSLATQVGSRLESDHVVALQVFMHNPAAARTLIIDNVRVLRAPANLDGIVDEFGQYTRADWPGKVKSTAEFAVRRAAEEAQRQAQPTLPERDPYGGWADGPTLTATGFFRTEKRDGKWWLVTPAGHLFFSLGMDCIGLGNATFTTGREKMFTWLPGPDDPLARHVGHAGGVHSGPLREGATFNFFAANLERKFGRDYEQPYFDEALARLGAWGFNTIGNWSDRRLYGNGRVPYVVTVNIGGHHARVSSGSDYWGRMHDPFDPQFAEDVATAVSTVAAQVKDDPWCLGYFVDNELSWAGAGEDGGRYGLALGTLAADEKSHAKTALMAGLREKYGSCAALNEAWGLQLPDWEALQRSYTPPGKLTDAQKRDLAAFVRRLADLYFRTVRDQLHKADLNHLYLGCRFAWQTQDAVAASAEFCDVVSFNIYERRPDATRLAQIEALNKPCMIGEFHFGALDRGMFHTGLVAAADQQARAAMYAEYVRCLLDSPAFVGCHWFQYVDQPLTGRTLDGENYSIGFVTVTDTPYPELVAVAQAIHREAYARRTGVRP